MMNFGELMVTVALFLLVLVPLVAFQLGDRHRKEIKDQYEDEYNPALIERQTGYENRTLNNLALGAGVFLVLAVIIHLVQRWLEVM